MFQKESACYCVDRRYLNQQQKSTEHSKTEEKKKHKNSHLKYNVTFEYVNPSLRCELFPTTPSISIFNTYAIHEQVSRKKKQRLEKKRKEKKNKLFFHCSAIVAF